MASEKGAVLAVRVLGTVVTINVSSNTAGSGDETTISISSHGGMTDSHYDSEVPGTIITPVDMNDSEDSELKTMDKMRATPVEMTGNLKSDAIDTLVSVGTVKWYNSLSTTDNMAVIVPSACLSESGVDTATNLILKHTNGNSSVTSGATIDVGRPKRDSEWHLGTKDHKKPVKPVPIVKSRNGPPCNTGVRTVL